MTDKPRFRKTKIIATIGPACDDVDTLTRMIESGMNVARLNLSHGNYEEHGEPDDVTYLVRDHFDEYLNWAYDDLIISSEERDLLLYGKEWELVEAIKIRAEILMLEAV